MHKKRVDSMASLSYNRSMLQKGGEPMNHGIGYQFKIIDEKIKVRADEDLKRHDLTLMQTRVLGFLAEVGGQATQKEIEDDLEVSHPTVVGLVFRMEQKGFLSFRCLECVLSCRHLQINICTRDYRGKPIRTERQGQKKEFMRYQI